jgi:hypothetical protein
MRLEKAVLLRLEKEKTFQGERGFTSLAEKKI